MLTIITHIAAYRDHKVQLVTVDNQVHGDLQVQEMPREDRGLMDRMEKMASLEFLAHKDHRCVGSPFRKLFYTCVTNYCCV